MKKRTIVLVGAIIFIVIFGIGAAFFCKYFVNKNVWAKYTSDQLMTMADKNWTSKAMFFKGLEGNFIIIDQGTAPYPRGLIIYDLNNKKEVFSDKYSQPLDITGATVNYWEPTTQKVTAVNCPELVNWAKEGLGAEMEKHVSFILTTLTLKDLSEAHRCMATQ